MKKTTKLQEIESDKKAAKIGKTSQKKTPLVAKYIQGLRKDPQEIGSQEIDPQGNDYAYLTAYAGEMIRQIQESQVDITPYRGSGEIESEINGYKIITQDDGLRPNNYTRNTITKIKTAITFFRGKMLGWGKGTGANIYQQKIII